MSSQWRPITSVILEALFGGALITSDPRRRPPTPFSRPTPTAAPGKPRPFKGSKAAKKAHRRKRK